MDSNQKTQENNFFILLVGAGVLIQYLIGKYWKRGVFHLLALMVYGVPIDVSGGELSILKGNQLVLADIPTGINQNSYCDEELSRCLIPGKLENKGLVYIDPELKEQEKLKSALLHSDRVFHIFSHGRPGELLIGGEWKKASEIVDWINQIKVERPIDSIFIYGCHFAHGSKGKQAVFEIEHRLGVSVAASTDLSGKGGNWILELGEVDYSFVFRNYNYNLQCTNYSGQITDGGSPLQDVNVSLYADNNNDGILDANDVLLTTTTTDVSGNYLLTPPSTTGDFADDFEGNVFSGTNNSTGSLTWTNDDFWTASGTISDVNSSNDGFPTKVVSVSDNGSFFSRGVDLSPYSSGTFNYQYDGRGSLEGTDGFFVEYSSDGGSTFNLLASHYDDPGAVQSESVILPAAALVADFVIRFRVDNCNGAGEFFYIDNIQIEVQQSPDYLIVPAPSCQTFTPVSISPAVCTGNDFATSGILDSDGDGVCDGLDLDDDNDGIRDEDEWYPVVCPLITNSTFDSDLSGWTASGNVLHSGTYNAARYSFNSNTYDGEISQTISTTSGERYNLNFDIFKDGGSGDVAVEVLIDGVSIGLFSTSSTTPSAQSIDFTASGTSTVITFSDATTGTSKDLVLDNIITECNDSDIDNDGVVSRLDLDADGDGIPDNVEAQSTNGYLAPNADSPATYASNNGVNSAYSGGIAVIDTDSDGFPDFLDLDSDSDRMDDREESGLSLTGIIGNNGLDLGVETSDDYSDVNGIVNNPLTDLAQITSNDSTEVDYRDKQLPPVVTLCYNDERYGIGGQRMSFHDDKLLNPTNFGEFGIAYYEWNLVNLGDGQNITSSMLTANGCDVFFMGGTNSEASSFTSTASFSTTALDALRDWALSPNHVMIAFQGHAVSMGGTELVNGTPTNLFGGVNGNNNPNTLTELGETVISGDFGQTNAFNQGGSFQGHFTTFPSFACAIIEDASTPSRPTGLINGSTGDFYFSDFGLVDELGGVSSSANIITNNDILFANLMASAARVSVEGPANVCSFFLCPAGDEAPDLTTTSISSAGSPVDLPPLYAGTPATPSGAALTWHNATPVADSNYIGNASNYTESGIVYAAFRAFDGSCYSPSTPLIVSVDYPDLDVFVTPASDTSSQAQVQSFTITVANNGPIDAPGAQVKVPIPVDRQLILATPTAGLYSATTKIWDVGPLSSGQSETLEIIIRLQ